MTLKLKNLFFMVANTCKEEIKLNGDEKQVSLIRTLSGLVPQCCIKCDKYQLCNRLLNDLIDTYEKEQQQEIEVIV